MGLNYRWAAIRGATVDEIAGALGFHEVSIERSVAALAVLTSGWLLVDCDISEARVRQLSIRCEALILVANETAMVVQLSCYRDGADAWRMANDPDDPGELWLDGAPDPIVHEYIARARACIARELSDVAETGGPIQAYDVIVDVATQLTGYDVSNFELEPSWVYLAPT